MKRKVLYLLLIFFFISITFSIASVKKVKYLHFQVPIDLNCNLLNNQFFCNITIKNVNLTFPDVYLTIDLVKEGKTGYIYPSQYSDDNIFFEKNIKLNLLPNEVKTISFNYNFSNEFSKGKYRIDVYLHSHYISLSGIPFIFYNPKSYEFYLNSFGNFPYIKINRECTNLENIVGPIGGLLNKSKAKLTICLDSKVNGTAKIKIYIAKWNDIAFKPIIKQEFTVKVGKGLNKISKVIDISKLKPDAYSLRIEVYYDNKLNSLYRLRFIVPGPTAKIRGIYSD